MRILVSFLIITFAFTQLQAQVTSDPVVPVDTEAVTIIFNASEGSAGLKDYTGDVYAHTGVLTDKSSSNTDWRYVKTDWGKNSPDTKLNRLDDNRYEFKIEPSIREYYGVPDDEKIEKMAFVFRSGDSSKEGKAEAGKDIFIDVFIEGLGIRIITPDNNNIFEVDQQVTIAASTTIEASISIWINDEKVISNSGMHLETNYSFSEVGEHMIVVKAVAEGVEKTDTVSIYIKGETVTENRPQYLRKGINYLDDNSVGLVLWAPYKKSVFVLTEMSNFKPDEEFHMKKDGDYFWIVIEDLDKGKDYVFQYLIDGKIRIADPYAEQVSDPWNDKFISNSTYPGLVQYPDGKTEGIAAVFQTGQEAYQWQIDDFTPPDKEKMVIYELLIRDFTKEHSYQSVIDKLDYLQDLNVNVLELMPVNEFEGNLSWGYNPSFYFAPDKYYGHRNDLKKLIDECHKRGIAVVIDMVLNHSYGQSPFAQMYMSNWVINEENPWYNIESNFENGSLTWGYDFDHESDATKELIDSINSFWINEYKIDGFRFDFTKGFSNTPYGSSSWGSEYDTRRIANLKRMADEIWKKDDGTIIIFEHLADNEEEKELADYGILMWGNMSHNYGEGAMGWVENNKSDISWGLYTERNWNQPNLITYMESHDEERMMYKLISYGKSSGEYNTKFSSTALDRVELSALFFLPMPGPKMIWQFGELGYDISINYNGRVGEKPIFWNYTLQDNRTDLFRVMSKLNYLKQNYDEFSTHEIEHALQGAVKWYRLSHENNHVIVIGNFDVVNSSVDIKFPVSGIWHEYFSRTEEEFKAGMVSIELQPGEYRLYSTRKFDIPEIKTEKTNIENNQFLIYPNPFDDVLYSKSNCTLFELYDLYGKRVFKKINNEEFDYIETDFLKRGIYIYKATYASGKTMTGKLLKQE